MSNRTPAHLAAVLIVILTAFLHAESFATQNPRRPRAATGPTTTPATTTSAPASVKRIVFVVDATGTMLGLKFKLAQKQTAMAIDALSPDDRFNIIFFRGGDNDDEWRHPFSPKLQAASEENKAKARKFIDATEVVGKGTNPMPALRLAFQQRPDAIEFLTDGQFDNVISYEGVIAEIGQMNRQRRTQLNTTAFMSDDPRGEEVLQTLARQHDGRFIKVSDKNFE